MNKFRALNKNEIECRIGTIGENYLTLLLYKNARCDMNILDETVGAENWQREHYECKGNLFCKVGINVNFDDNSIPRLWVWKDDCGTESYTEKEKGEASDSFKRACVNWGIGRELYTAPNIYIRATEQNGLKINKKSNGKFETKCNFFVSHIKTVDGVITELAIDGKFLSELNGKKGYVTQRMFTWAKK